MNIQFMKKTVDGSDGYKKFLPDFDEMIKHACCEEEITMLKKWQKKFKDENFMNFFEGFNHQICFTKHAHDICGKRIWTLNQYAWPKDDNGKLVDKQKMMNEIKIRFA